MLSELLSPPDVANAPPSAAWSERLQLLLESTGEGIFGIDLAGRCTFVNRAAAEMLGYRTEQVHGRNMHELIHHTHADGSAFSADYSSHPVVDNGGVQGAVVTVVDIGARKRTEAQPAAARRCA